MGSMGTESEPEHRQGLGTPSIESLANAHPTLLKEFRKLDPAVTAASFAALLTAPELQANCYRLEYLVHLAVAYCNGQARPTQDLIQRAFKILGVGVCGMAEDPAEDVFVSLVSTPRGNFRVFEGIHEGNGFHLQRILNVVETMPQEEPFERIRNAVEAVLRLSEALAKRAGLAAGDLGQELPLKDIPKGALQKIPARRQNIQFSNSDLEQLGMSRSLLSEFAFGPGLRSLILSQSPGDTELERRPLVFHNGAALLLLPTAVGPALTRFVIEAVLSMGLTQKFERALANEFAKLFRDTPLLGGGAGAPIIFQEIRGLRVASIARKVDPGRFMQIVFLVDGLAGFQESGLGGLNADPDGWGSVFEEHVRQAAGKASGEHGFKGGISIFVTCGYGRTVGCTFGGDLPADWRTEFMSAHDFVTLSWLTGFNALSFWRLLDAQEAIERQGVALMNISGVLNLVAWSRYLKGHLVPNGQLGTSTDGQGPNMILVQQNMLRDLRREVAMDWSPQRVPDVDGRFVRVRGMSKSLFEEDGRKPLFGSEEDLFKGELRGVYLARNRPWWVGIGAPEGAPSGSIFQHWEMLCGWIGRAAPVLDGAYPGLPPGPILFHFDFEELAGDARGPIKAKNKDELAALLTIDAEPGNPKVRIVVASGYGDGFSQAENTAEVGLVEMIIRGAEQAAGEAADPVKRAALLHEICPDSEARYIHRFEARSFRDYAHSEIDEDPVLIDQMDDATYRVGLGWRVRSRGETVEFLNPAACTAVLNDIVRIVLNDMCELLRGLDRRSFVKAVLANHERAVFDRDHWNRTTRAVLALHNEKEAAVRTMVQHHSRLNACGTASRILLEAAICECPISGGSVPGQLDLSRLMALSMLAFYYGGWSDAIHWGAAEPRVRITPLGDVHMDHKFMDAVYEPFGRSVAERDVNRARGSYEKLYQAEGPQRSVADVVESKFLDAWKEEFRIPLEGVRAFLGALEREFVEPPRPVSELRHSALAGMLATAAGVPLQNAVESLALLTLVPRPGWRTTHPPFAEKDWYPWRFRRRLSVLRRPFIQIDSTEDPAIAFAPGLVGDSLRAIVARFESGEIPPSQAVSSAMKKWIGHANNMQRTEFNSSVSARMEELGWRTRKEVTLTGLLRRPLDRNYGDIDVLAWHPNLGRVLAIECKDLQFNKTLGEVAEQLSDFRGEIRPDGNADHLKKHLERLNVLGAHAAEVAKELELGLPMTLEGHLVFRNPVPMKFAWDRIAGKVRLSLFSELDKL